MKKTLIAAAILAAAVMPIQAAITITEFAPWSSGDSPFAADWFELTNTGTTSVSLANWRVDDNSNSFGSGITLTGVSSIAAGESVIFLEGSATEIAGFRTTWFGSSTPNGIQVGSYSGSGIGLSTGGDALNIYNAAGILQANVTFGASGLSGGKFRTFDNSDGSSGAVADLSVVGVNGAFLAPGDVNEVGSPGVVAAVPEPATAAFGLGLLGLALSKRRRVASRA